MSGWDTATIGSVCSTYSGGTPSTTHPEYYHGRIPWIVSADLNQGRIRSVKGRITELGLARSSAKIVRSGTPLIALYGATAGVAAVSCLTGAINQAVLAMVPRDVDPEFLFQWLLINREAIIARYTQGGQPNLSGEIVRTIEIPLPPLSEQRRIAGALQNVDDLIDSLQRVITKKQAIKQGMMQELLTGRTRLPGFDGEWNDVSLGSIATVTMGQSPAGATYNSDSRGTPLVQGNADIRDRVTFDRVWTTAPTKLCKRGDVILTVRAPVGYTAIASRASCLGRGVCALSTKSDNRCLFHALVYVEPSWALYEQGSTFTAVNSNEVRSFTLRWPADADERSAIAHVLDDAEDELRIIELRLGKARAIKQGMMQELLTGRTRLPVQEAVA